MKVAYIECSTGAAGDMLLAALLDAGASEATVRNALESLSLEGWSLSFEETRRSGIRAHRAVVSTSDTTTSRTYTDIVALLDESTLGSATKRRALHAFEILGRAEAAVHGIDIDRVHFHEVGAVDAIVDIVGSCAALDSLAVDRVIVSPVATGTGSISSAHGTLPLPAPAVLEIFSGTKASLFERGKQELITPTGAALLVAVADDFAPLPHMSIDAIGYGAGSAELDFPNVVRVLIGTSFADEAPTEVVLVETNIDDMSPELLPHVVERLLSQGAQDAWITPIIMKKGRPAFTLSVLCTTELEEEISDVIFRETTTLGTRTTRASKRALKREWVDTEVAGHRVRVKIGRRRDEITTVAPEHDDAVAAAEASGLPLKQIYERAVEQVTGRNGSR